MAKLNGNGGLWKVLIWAASALIAIGIAYASIGQNTSRIDKMEPDVKANNEHRLKDETDTVWLKEKVTNIEKMQAQILREVQKR